MDEPESRHDDLTPAAREVLGVAEHTARFFTGAGVSREAFIRDMLGLAGVSTIDRSEIPACGWPTDMALDVVRAFFYPDGSLAKLRVEHLKSEASALRAFETVRVALFETLRLYVPPSHYKHAVRFASVLPGNDFEELSSIVQADLRDEDQQDHTPRAVASYLAGTYVRTLLRDDAVAEYFPNAVWTEAIRRVAEVLEDGAGRLVADNGEADSAHR